MKGMPYPIEKLTIYEWDPRIEPKNENKKREAEQEYQRLKRSIAVDGIIVPLMVVPSGNTYEVIAGRHRLRAAKELGLKTVPISIREDIESEVKKRRDSGSENNIRSGGDEQSLSKWMFAMYEAGGYTTKQAMSGAKAIDNWFSHYSNNKTDWNLLHNSVMQKSKGREAHPLLADPKFVEICEAIPYAPKYQYQVMSILEKLDNSVRDKAQRKGLSTNKQISLTTGMLPEHPTIQKELIDEIADMSKDRATARVQQVAGDLASGRLKKEGKRYTHDYKVKKEDGKVLPPINVRILDINASINKFLFNMTQRAITKGEHEFSEKTIQNTKSYRIEILKTLDERNLINLERGLRFVQTVTDEMLELIESEYESAKMKEKMTGK
jgi:hypothetical protein